MQVAQVPKGKQKQRGGCGVSRARPTATWDSLRFPLPSRLTFPLAVIPLYHSLISLSIVF